MENLWRSLEKIEINFWMGFDRVADSFLMNKCDFFKGKAI
ncbi:MAG: hypothetical protein RJB18_903 [Pseudomonadota bacterium]|jgi:hypothetical protein